MNRNDDVDVLAGAAVRARQDLNAATGLRPVPALPSHSRRHGLELGGGWRRLLRSAAFSGVAVAVLVLGILVGIRLVDDGGRASPPPGRPSPSPSDPLQPGAELDGMYLTTATPWDRDIFTYCDPIIRQYGTYARDCAVPQLGRLMIGHGSFATSQELLEQLWQAQRWRLYLDGQEVDLSAFGTLPDRPYVDTDLGEVRLRLWAVTLVSPTRGQHTLRYVMEQSPVGDDPGGASDTTWTFTV